MEIKSFDLLKKIIITLFWFFLYFEDVTEFIVKNKKVSSSGKRSKQYYLQVLSINGKYLGTINVTNKEFYSVKKGEVFRELAVIKHRKNENFLLLSKHLDSSNAIFKEWMFAVFQFLILMVVCILIIMSIASMLLPIFG